MKNILIAISDNNLRAEVSNIVKEIEDVTTIEKVNGKDALDFISENIPDMAIMEVDLSHVSGKKIVHLLHCEFKAFFPVIMLKDKIECHNCKSSSTCQNKGNELTYCDANVIVLDKKFDNSYMKLLISKFIHNGE